MVEQKLTFVHYACLIEYFNDNRLLNKRNEFISGCRLYIYVYIYIYIHIYMYIYIYIYMYVYAIMTSMSKIKK